MKALEIKSLGLEEMNPNEARVVDGGNPIFWKVIEILITAYGGWDILSDFKAGWDSENENTSGGAGYSGGGYGGGGR